MSTAGRLLVTRFVRRATIAAALIAAPMLAVPAPALAAGTAQPAVTSVVSAGQSHYAQAHHYSAKKKKRPAATPTSPVATRPTTQPAPTTPPTATNPTTTKPTPTSPTATKPTAANPTTTNPTTTKPSTTPPTTTPPTTFAPPTTPPTTAPVTLTAYEAQVVTLTNAERLANGCGALRVDDRLVVAARLHSSDMVKQNFFSHTGSNGGDFVAHEIAAGYTVGASAENIAWGYRTPQEVVTGWMNSPGHRANILNCTSIAVGVGLALAVDGTPYWTQDFGRV
jgi:uncharacterized protein YkwD